MTEALRQAGAPAPTGARSAARPSDWRSFLLLVAIAAACAGFRLLPLGIEPRAHSALAIGIFMIVSWMTQEDPDRERAMRARLDAKGQIGRAHV